MFLFQGGPNRMTAPTSIPEEEVTALLIGQTQNDLKLATEYLRHYYNLKKEQPLGRIKRYLPSFTSKVKDMQSFFGLNTTGSLDSKTLEVMRTPRCGVSDVEDYSHNNRVNRWNKNVITYSIGRYTSDLPHSTVDSLIESALSVWARASTLTFVRSRTQRADIMVEFATFGFNLYLVAAHEFGHSLGLRHSQNPESLMYPTYKSSRSAHNLLSKEDIAIINSLYETMYWTVKGSIVKGKPKPISNFGFPPWVQEVDAAVHIVKTGRTLFFIHNIYYSYNENRRVMDAGYPQYISDDFPGLNTTIDAAVYKDGFIYFFVGPQVYTYDYTQKQVVGTEKANTWLGC
ncbi:hypothetical protein J4Q44_G00327380 [Coregonus suidteri]|uniref:Peptidase metallopeptidase domain-containing protein n=1 Tax=Coregonus suidteri TaxID=861788 RepID=A0AAN8KXF2_9TELE